MHHSTAVVGQYSQKRGAFLQAFPVTFRSFAYVSMLQELHPLLPDLQTVCVLGSSGTPDTVSLDEMISGQRPLPPLVPLSAPGAQLGYLPLLQAMMVGTRAVSVRSECTYGRGLLSSRNPARPPGPDARHLIELYGMLETGFHTFTRLTDDPEAVTGTIKRGIPLYNYPCSLVP
jgi:hypothetical protein